MPTIQIWLTVPIGVYRHVQRDLIFFQHDKKNKFQIPNTANDSYNLHVMYTFRSNNDRLLKHPIYYSRGIMCIRIPIGII